MAKILSVGYLQDFLRKRGEVLASAGYQVVSVCSVDEVIKALEKTTFDIAIFGHGVPTHDRNVMTGHIKECCPSTSVIFLYEMSIERAEAADAILNIHGAPSDLINTVQYLLDKKKMNRGVHHMAGAILSACTYGGFFI